MPNQYAIPTEKILERLRFENPYEIRRTEGQVVANDIRGKHSIPSGLSITT